MDFRCRGAQPAETGQFELLLLFDELLVEVLVLVDELVPELLCESVSFAHVPLEQLLERDREMLVDFEELSVRLPIRTSPFAAVNAASPIRAGIRAAWLDEDTAARPRKVAHARWARAAMARSPR